MMKQYVLNADSVLAFLENKAGATTVEELLWKAAQAQQHLHISVVSWAFLLSSMRKAKGEKLAREKERQLRQLPIDFIELDSSVADNAARIHAAYEVSFPDSFAAALAQQRRATLVTANKDLQKLSEEVKILVAG